MVAVLEGDVAAALRPNQTALPQHGIALPAPTVQCGTTTNRHAPPPVIRAGATRKKYLQP